MHSSQKGFSLIEALIAVVILSSGLLVVGRFQAAKLEDTALSKQRLEAIKILNTRLESIRSRWLIRRARVDNGSMTCASGFSAKSCFANYLSGSLPTLPSSDGAYTLSNPVVVNGATASASGSFPIPIYKDVTVNAAWTYKGKNYTQAVTMRLGYPAMNGNL
ncbi:type IV pilus modification PilV family protein [Chitiniphilus eburneus]|nr:prepilin-type N-terminal cleavage/methylation domain-containing protein [Chitiniphilus eburneus]